MSNYHNFKHEYIHGKIEPTFDGRLIVFVMDCINEQREKLQVQLDAEIVAKENALQRLNQEIDALNQEKATLQEEIHQLKNLPPTVKGRTFEEI